MVSKARAKFIKSLQLKKYRVSEQTFVVEGTKSVLEVLASDYDVIEVVATPGFSEQYHDRLRHIPLVETATPDQLAALGSFRSNDGALAIVRMKENVPFPIASGYGLMLDQLNDPGNLGTIIRIADWYGLKGIVASENVPDLYNPKVIAASKGSFTRVNVYYTNLARFAGETDLPLFGADLQGEDVHDFSFPPSGWIVMGSEAHGISAELQQVLTSCITIPSYGKAESLNVGMATAVICDNLRRNIPA